VKFLFYKTFAFRVRDFIPQAKHLDRCARHPEYLFAVSSLQRWENNVPNLPGSLDLHFKV